MELLLESVFTWLYLSRRGIFVSLTVLGYNSENLILIVGKQGDILLIRIKKAH